MPLVYISGYQHVFLAFNIQCNDFTPKITESRYPLYGQILTSKNLSGHLDPPTSLEGFLDRLGLLTPPPPIIHVYRFMQTDL